MTLKQKLTISFLSITFLLVGVGLTNIYYLYQIHQGVYRIETSNVGEINGAGSLVYQIVASKSDLVEMFLTASHTETGIDKDMQEIITQRLQRLEQAASRLKQSTTFGQELAEDEEQEAGEQEEHQQISRLWEGITAYEKLIARTFEILESKDLMAAVNVYLSESKEVEQDIRSTSISLYTDAISEIEDEIHEIHSSILVNITLTVAFATLSAILAFVIGRSTSREITQRIGRLKQGTKKIRDGNFDVQIDCGTIRDEIYDLTETFNHMAEKLKTSTASLQELNTEIQRRQDADNKLKSAHILLEERDVQRTAELRDAKRDAESANRAKNDFLANMSNELHSPLNRIISFTELIVDERFGSLNEMQKEYLEEALDNSKHLLMLINDILDLSKIEAGSTKLAIGPVDIHELLRNCVSKFKEKAAHKRQNLSLEIEQMVPETILADQMKIRQVMHNLIANACTFTHDGGTIRVTAKRSALSGDGRADHLQITVQDDGIGIEQSHLERIFAPFEQANKDNDDFNTGAGLGLALSKGFIEMHGGTITAASKGPDTGSVFTISIPTKGPSPQEKMI